MSYASKHPRTVDDDLAEANDEAKALLEIERIINAGHSERRTIELIDVVVTEALVAAFGQ